MPANQRPVRTRLELSLSSSRENGSCSAARGNGAGADSTRRNTRKAYTDLDYERGRDQNRRRSSEASIMNARQRPAVLPENLLTRNTATAPYRRLPEAVEVESRMEEVSILRKWEQWSTRMGEQLTLDGTVPAAVSGRNTPPNGSFRSTSQFSSRSGLRARPPSVRGASPLRQGGGNESSRCSTRSRSRRSSVGSESVVPFRVGDRLTASAERRRHQPWSTKESRELLFRRALGMVDDDDGGTAVEGSTSAPSQRGAPVPAPLITLGRSTRAPEPCSSAEALSAQRRMEVVEGQRAQAAAHVAQDKMWTKQVKELIGDRQSVPAASASVSKVPLLIPKPESKPPDVSAPGAADLLKRTWSLPVDEASRVRCLADAPLRLNAALATMSVVPGRTKTAVVTQVASASSDGETVVALLGLPLDRTVMNVIFVDHHVDDDQMSAYGVELSPRDEFHPHVLPDWNESRRRFAPSPLAQSREFP